MFTFNSLEPYLFYRSIFTILYNIDLESVLDLPFFCKHDLVKNIVFFFHSFTDDKFYRL